MTTQALELPPLLPPHHICGGAARFSPAETTMGIVAVGTTMPVLPTKIVPPAPPVVAVPLAVG